MRFEVVKVTPRIAESWLQKNTSNRPLRAAHIDSLAGAMRRGEWKESHQGIAFSKKGDLLDGQHRLNAVMLSGMTVTMTVMKDVPPESFDSFDLGARRSAADVLGISTGLAAVAAFIARIVYSDIRGQPTPQMLFPIAQAWAPYFESLTGDGNRTLTKIWTSASVRTAAVIRIADGESRDYVRSVYAALAHRDFDSMPPVARALFRQHLDGLKASGVDMFARCLTTFSEEKSMLKKIQITSTDSALKTLRQVHQDVMDGKEKARKNTGPKVAKVKPDYIAA